MPVELRETLDRLRERLSRASTRADRLRAALPDIAWRLREKFGVTDVILFGSLATRRHIHESSDVDLAVRGLPIALQAEAWAELEGELRAPVDLIDLDTVPQSLVDRIRDEGIPL